MSSFVTTPRSLGDQPGLRRPTIIDLSEAGHQPTTDAQLGLTLVFNGRTYNHQALRHRP
jgi:asparagine synthetase B (glutamine-hydrolysing)